MTDKDRPYTVLLLGDNGEGWESSELICSADFHTIEEATTAYLHPEQVVGFVLFLDDADRIELEGPDVMKVRPLHPRQPGSNDDSWSVVLGEDGHQ